jgi:hypothetical protein
LSAVSTVFMLAAAPLGGASPELLDALGAGTWNARYATMETDDFSQFHSINSNSSQGWLSIDSTRAYEGSRSARATTPAGTGTTKFARGIWVVSWGRGTDVWYGAAFYLPSDFYSRQQGDVDILRWDNWTLEQRSQDQSGLTILWDHRLALLRKNLDSGDYTMLTNPIAPLSTGAWHLVEVHQRLSSDSASALNELYVDGSLVASSTTENWYGREVTALRVGIVATNDQAQMNGLKLRFDQAFIVEWSPES